MKFNKHLTPKESVRNSNLLCRTDLDNKTACKSGRYYFTENFSANIVPRNQRYRGPKLVQGKRWYVEYYFRVPEELEEKFKGKSWERFRVFEDINRIKTVEYARILLKAVKNALEWGYDPFAGDKEILRETSIPNKTWTLNEGLNYFKQKWFERGLEDASKRKYERTLKLLTEFFRERLNEPAEKIIDTDIENFLSFHSESWGNKSYNSYKGFCSTIFGFMQSKRIIVFNPCDGIGKRKTASKKHRAYDDETFSRLRKILLEKDPLLFFAAQLVYYLCIRSEKELKYLKLGNIFLDRKQVLISAENSKTDTDRYISIPDELMDDFKYLKESFPGDYYVIGVSHKNKFIPDNTPSKEPFGNGFLSKRFSKIRKAADLSSDHTLFGLRHTRCVHLKLDGATDVDIMNLMGHRDFATTSKYLRDIGLASDGGRINKLGRKF